MPNYPRPFRPQALMRSGFLAILLLLTLLPGCVVGDFISVYFNTFYNAQRMFKDAEEEVWALPETRMSGRNLMTELAIPQGSRTKFTQIIEKCSKLLQYHPDSRYVDDALLMIAKSYYYQGDFQRTDRKCLELIDGFPGSDLVLEARLLLACAQYKGNNKEDAEVSANAVVAQATDNGDNGVVARASLVLAAVAADAKRYDEARIQYQRAGELGDNADIRAGSLLRAAEMYAQVQNYAAAQDMYGRAASASENYVSEYRARIGIARMLDARGLFKDALDLLQGLRGNTNNREFFGEISLEIANVYRDMGDVPMAIEQYHRVDTAYARTEAAAKSYYQLGLLYESTLYQYDSARVVYNRGRTEWPAALVTPMLNRRADYLNRYFQFKNDLARYDSLRTVALARKDSLPAESVRSDTTLAKGTDSLRRVEHKAPTGTAISIDSIDYHRASLMDEMATLLYATMGRPDSAVVWYHRLLSEFPDGPFVPRVLYTLAQINSLDSTASHATTDSLYRELVRRYPETSFASEARRLLGLPPEERKIDPAEATFGRAIELIDQKAGRSAADSLKDLLRRLPASPLAPKAAYTIGWIYENVVLQPDSSFAYYDRVVRLYPGTPYAMRVFQKVFDPQVRAQILAPAAKQDSTAPPAPPGKVEATPPPPPPGQPPKQQEAEPHKGQRPEESPGTREEDPKANPGSGHR